MIICNKEHCNKNIYIGETGRILKHRLADHRGYVVNKMTKITTVAHFNTTGHTLAIIKITFFFSSNLKIHNTEKRDNPISLSNLIHITRELQTELSGHWEDFGVNYTVCWLYNKQSQ